MKQCQKCYRFLCDHVSICLYCKNESFHSLVFENSVRNNYKVYTDEIVFEGQVYQVKEPLGRGGFGTVIKVYDPVEEKYYAMKVPKIFDKIWSNNQGIERDELEISRKYIEEEINTIRKYRHDAFLHNPKIGMVKTGSKTGYPQFPAFLLELAEGTLNDLIQYEKEGNPISYDEKIKTIRGIVNAITILHRMGIVHRDLSPRNLFVVNRGDTIAYVLGDFGSSKRLLELKKKECKSAVVGPEHYLDPIRIKNRKEYNTDVRCDIFSLGVIVTEILIGRYWRDFFEDDVSFYMQFDFEKEFLLKYGPDYINENVLRVIQCAVKKDIEKRYSCIDDFRDKLFHALGTNTVKTLLFHFTLKLPFDIGKSTICRETIRFTDGEPVTLSNYRGVEIIFEDFTPRRVKIKNTQLYDALVINNSIRLNFKNKEFQKAQEIITPIMAHINGELHFRGIIEIEGS